MYFHEPLHHHSFWQRYLLDHFLNILYQVIHRNSSYVTVEVAISVVVEFVDHRPQFHTSLVQVYRVSNVLVFRNRKLEKLYVSFKLSGSRLYVVDALFGISKLLQNEFSLASVINQPATTCNEQAEVAPREE